MQQAFVYLLLIIATAQVCITAAASNDVVTQNLKLYVSGSEYFIKAICYSPVPLGSGVQQSNGDVGGGFCSPKVSPFGNTVSSCYDSDYFDGGSNADGKPNPSQGGWFQQTWARDLPIMKSAGANTLRLYSANPTTKQASVYYPEMVTLPLGKDHVPFMDMAQQYGFKVIFPLISDYGMMTTYTDVQFKRLLRWQIDELGNHNALLMWAFGNELPLNGNPTLVAMLNSYIAYIKQYTFAKWGRRVPVTCAVVDDPSSYDYLAAALDVDVFTSNAGYRGTSLTDLWSGNTLTQGWAKLSCRYNKPLFIGEINYPSLNNAISYTTPNWFNSIWQDVVNHIDQGCIGGAFFEYSDEPGKADALQQTMGIVSFSVNTTSAGSSTQEFVWNTDIATTKPEVFNQVASGSVNGLFYNMNSSPYYLIGRAQSLLSTSASVCGAYSYKTCPGNNVCSYNGMCDGSSGVCTCNSGWSGSDCSTPVCTNACTGRGQCLTTVSPPVCSCSAGWTGADCSVQLTTSNCNTYCAAGNGQCSTSGACVCYSGWLGTDCSIPDTSYPPANSTVTSAPTTPAPVVAATTAPTTTTTTIAPTTAAPTTTTTVAPTTTTTKAPTTAAPTTTTTTVAPTTTTTKAPSTAAPTTVAPSTTTTTKAPSTAAPTTVAPTTTTTTTKAPTTAAPTTAAPTTAAPTAAPTVAATTAPTAAQNSSCFVQCGSALSCCGYSCYSPSQYGCAGTQLCQIGQPGCTSSSSSSTTTTTAAPTAAATTAAPTTTTTVKAVPTTVAPTTAAPTTVKATTAPTTAAPTTTTQAASTTTTTQQANSACGSLQSCGSACYNSQFYTCFDGFLCTNPNQRCGQTCYDPTLYTCVNNQIAAL